MKWYWIFLIAIGAAAFVWLALPEQPETPSKPK